MGYGNKRNDHRISFIAPSMLIQAEVTLTRNLSERKCKAVVRAAYFSWLTHNNVGNKKMPKLIIWKDVSSKLNKFWKTISCLRKKRKEKNKKLKNKNKKKMNINKNKENILKKTVLNTTNLEEVSSINIAFYNVRTLNSDIDDSLKLSEIAAEAQYHNIDILCMSEIKFKGKGIREIKIQEIQYTFIWSGVDSSQKAYGGVGILLRKKYTQYIQQKEEIEVLCDERIQVVILQIESEDIYIISLYSPTNADESNEGVVMREIFHKKLQKILKLIPNDAQLYCGGDFNARIGQSDETTSNQIGPYVDQDMLNHNGELIRDHCSQFKLMIINTFYEKGCSGTFEHGPSGQCLQLDYILVKQKFQENMLDCMVLKEFSFESDHYPIVLKTKLKKVVAKAQKKKIKVKKYDYSELKWNTDLACELTVKLEQEMQKNVKQDDNTEIQFTNIINSINNVIMI
jgi:exonuclease III